MSGDPRAGHKPNQISSQSRPDYYSFARSLQTTNGQPQAAFNLASLQSQAFPHTSSGNNEHMPGQTHHQDGQSSLDQSQNWSLPPSNNQHQDWAAPQFVGFGAGPIATHSPVQLLSPALSNTPSLVGSRSFPLSPGSISSVASPFVETMPNIADQYAPAHNYYPPYHPGQLAYEHALTSQPGHDGNQFHGEMYLESTLCCPTPMPLCLDPSCTDVVPCPRSTSVCSDKSCDAVPCKVVVPCNDTSCQREDLVHCQDGLQCSQAELTHNVCWNPGCDETPCDTEHPICDEVWKSSSLADLPTAIHDTSYHGPDHNAECSCVDPSHMAKGFDQLDLGDVRPSTEGCLPEPLQPDTGFSASFQHGETQYRAPPLVPSYQGHAHDVTPGSQTSSWIAQWSREAQSASLSHPKSENPRKLLECRWQFPWSSTMDGVRLRSICGLFFETHKKLQDHLEQFHANNTNRTLAANGFACSWERCKRENKGFSSRAKLKRHAMTHSGYLAYKCTVPGCKTEMGTPDGLKKHLRTHFQEKPYPCTWPTCQSRFTTRSEMCTHYAVHTGKKDYICPDCGKPFADSSNLSKHKKIHFIGAYTCGEPGCETRTKQWDQIKQHWLTARHMTELLHGDEDRLQEYKHDQEQKWHALTEDERRLPKKVKKPTKAMAKAKSTARGRAALRSLATESSCSPPVQGEQTEVDAD